MEDELYHEAIVAAARAATGSGRLADADGSATADNPLCGDRVSIDLRLLENRVADVGQVVRGCVLCEATASIIAERAVGSNQAQLQTVADQVRAMLKAGGEAPIDRWSPLAAFVPVRDYKSRHQCVLLAFDALLDALEDARSIHKLPLPGGRGLG